MIPSIPELLPLSIGSFHCPTQIRSASRREWSAATALKQVQIRLAERLGSFMYPASNVRSVLLRAYAFVAHFLRDHFALFADMLRISAQLLCSPNRSQVVR
jgi:hypothetical protein